MTMLIEKEYNMKTTIFAFATAFALTTTSANADNIHATVTAEWDRFFLTLEGSEDNGYESATVGAEVLSYSMGTNIDSALDVYLTHYHNDDEYAVGAEYTVTYAPNALSVYGSAQVEYHFDDKEVLVTPTVGAAYVVAETVTAWGEVGYTWDASDDWNRHGAVAEVGVDFAVASNIMLTPSVSYEFDNGQDNDAQLNLGLSLKF
jgi:outer membrane protein W